MRTGKCVAQNPMRRFARMDSHRSKKFLQKCSEKISEKCSGKRKKSRQKF
jgi:hypothetical protein